MGAKQLLLTAVLLLSTLFSLGQELILFKGNNEKYGYKNPNGDIVIKAKYAIADDFHEGYAKVYMGTIEAALPLEDKFGFINKKGEIITQSMYTEASHFSNGYAVVVKRNTGSHWSYANKYRYINTEGKEVIPLIYENALNFYDGSASVQLEDKWGRVNANNEVVIPIKYDWIDTLFQENLLKVFNGYNRNPDCVSTSFFPVSTQNQKFENLFPKLLFFGTDSWVIFLAPINKTFLYFTNASINIGISSAKC